jgi:uncharacterized repeat protein (TIGR01451 family)
VVGVLLLLSQGASADAVISVDKTADPTSLPAPGGTVTFTVWVTNSGSGVVTLTLLTDDVYGNLDGKGTCVLTPTILAGDCYSCAFTGTVSSTVAGDVMTDVVTAVAEGDGGPTDTVTETATATVSITAGPLNYIVIEDAADGAGNAVTTHAMTAGQTFQVWAAGYDVYRWAGVGRGWCRGDYRRRAASALPSRRERPGRAPSKPTTGAATRMRRRQSRSIQGRWITS